jgi:hypothetical protein
MEYEGIEGSFYTFDEPCDNIATEEEVVSTEQGTASNTLLCI